MEQVELNGGNREGRLPSGLGSQRNMHGHSHAHDHYPGDTSHSHSHDEPQQAESSTDNDNELAESEHTATIVATFDRYLQQALSANQRRRADYWSLPTEHRALLEGFSELLKVVRVFRRAIAWRKVERGLSFVS